MTIEQIYKEFTAGSPGFIAAVQTHCGYGASNAEIKRIAAEADTAEKFQSVWEYDESWTDASNPSDDE